MVLASEGTAPGTLVPPGFSRVRAGPSGRRRFGRVRHARTRLLDPGPEVSGVAGSAQRSGDGSWLLHWPLDDTQWGALVAARPDLVVLANARVLLAEGEPFVQGDPRDPRTVGGSSRPVDAAGRRAPPPRLPDLPGNRPPRHDRDHLAGQRGNLLRPRDGSSEPARTPEERWCDCSACRGSGPPDRVAHALALLERERRAVVSATGSARLRERVEARLTSEPLLAELLRYADGHLAGLLDERTPGHRPRIAHLCPPRIAPPPGGAAVPGAPPDPVPCRSLEAGPLGRALLQDQTISELAVAPAVPLRDRRPPGRRRDSHRLGDLAPRCGPARARGCPAGPPLRYPGDRRLGRRRAARSTRGSRAPAARGNLRARPRPPRPRRVLLPPGLPSRSPCIPTGR